MATTHTNPPTSAAAQTDVNFTPASTLNNGAKLLGETILPGASLLMEGRFGAGALHTVGAIVACTLLGPLGALVVAADSFSRSLPSGEDLFGRTKKSLSKKALAEEL